MKNTYEIYDAMNAFREKQITSRGVFLQKKQNLERYKGSPAYAEDLKKIQDERDKANAEARAACKARIDPIFRAMYEANAKRRITAPTEEALRILTAVSMLEKPSKEFLDCVANSLDGNPLCLAVLDNVARKAWKDTPERWTPNYKSGRAAHELDPRTVAEAIHSLQHTCSEILNGSGANRVREMSAIRNQNVHGAKFDPDDLPQEEAYKSELDFYGREFSVNYDLFAAAVN